MRVLAIAGVIAATITGANAAPATPPGAAAFSRPMAFTISGPATVFSMAFQPTPADAAGTTPASQPDAPAGTGISGWLILLGLAAAVVAGTRGGRAAARSALDAISQRVGAQRSPVGAAAKPHARPATGEPRTGAGPMLCGVRGEFAGVELELGEDPVIIGRDPEHSQLVFVGDAPSVSGRHCSVRFDAQRQAIVLEDLSSTNGTFLRTGERVAAGVPQLLGPADAFYLGDPDVLFEVRY